MRDDILREAQSLPERVESVPCPHSSSLSAGRCTAVLTLHPADLEEGEDG